MDTVKPESIQDLINLEIPKYRRIWKPFMVKYDCQKIAEIGVFRGENFQLMIEHNPKLAVAVDSWKETGNPAENDSGFSQEKLDEQYECFRANNMNKQFVKLYRENSCEVHKRFEDEYFDLIYIDADHTYEGCKRDIELWYPKIKKGKFLTGDDYCNSRAKYTGVRFGVIQAVDEFAKENNLEVYTLPRNGWCLIRK